MTAKEKGKFEDMAKADKAHSEREKWKPNKDKDIVTASVDEAND